MRLTALQLQRAVLCVQREAAEVHRAESRHSDPETPTHTDIKQPVRKVKIGQGNKD